MKKDIHPKNYRKVVFHDNASGTEFLAGSTIATEEETKWTDGNTYPMARVEISSASHPFYTGNDKLIDTAGRVDKFKKRASKAATPKKKK